MFTYTKYGKLISPFLLLDHAGPAEFEPSNKPRGVGEHPHRGFETVTIVYSGEVEHADNHGNRGKIGPGDVQWMTAARGILHSEMHGMDFTKAGGQLEMVQLWVNLPAKHKMSSPHYQEIKNQNIPIKQLPDNMGSVRIISGEFAGTVGVAKTFTPVILWDVQLNPNAKIILDIPAGFNSAILVLSGELLINNKDLIKRGTIAFLSQSGESIFLETKDNLKLLVLGGEPINENIVGYGPFVMNSQEEIQQAMNDFKNNKF